VDALRITGTFVLVPDAIFRYRATLVPCPSTHSSPRRSRVIFSVLDLDVTHGLCFGSTGNFEVSGQLIGSASAAHVHLSKQSAPVRLAKPRA
jgi:hypothetical protein